MEKIKRIFWHEYRSHLRKPLLQAVLILAFCALIFGFQNELQIKILVLERMLPLMGVVLLSPLFEFEKEEEIQMLLLSKFHQPYYIHILRLLLRLGIYFGLTLFYIWGQYPKASFSFILNYGFHSFSIGILVSSFGVFAFGVTRHLVGSYVLPMMIFLLNWVAKPKQLGLAYLFRWSQDLMSPDELYFALGIGFMIWGIMAMNRRRSWWQGIRLIQKKLEKYF